MKNWIGKIGMVTALGFVLVLAGCGEAADNNNTNNDTTGGNQGFEHITGIEPGSGVVGAAENAVTAEYEDANGETQEGYDLDIEVVPSSSASMAASLQSAIEKEEWIVVTGWTPHWKFAAFDLKYLEDPKGVFGGEESINTIVRQGLEKDHPEAYQVLDNFNWSTDDMESIMLDVYENDTDPKDAAQTWIDNNRDKVDAWIEGVETVDNVAFDLVYVNWDSEIASTNMIALVLGEIGYDVEITPVDNAPMWQAVASGTHDGMVAAWLPATHGPQYAEFKDQVIDLGPNLEGARVGLVVPTYVDIDSMEEITTR